MTPCSDKLERVKSRTQANPSFYAHAKRMLAVIHAAAPASRAGQLRSSSSKSRLERCSRCCTSICRTPHSRSPCGGMATINSAPGRNRPHRIYSGNSARCTWAARRSKRIVETLAATKHRPPQRDTRSACSARKISKSMRPGTAHTDSSARAYEKACADTWCTS